MYVCFINLYPIFSCQMAGSYCMFTYSILINQAFSVHHLISSFEVLWPEWPHMTDGNGLIRFRQAENILMVSLLILSSLGCG